MKSGVEYRCTKCGVRIRADRPAVLYCITCKAKMVRWS